MLTVLPLLLLAAAPAPAPQEGALVERPFPPALESGHAGRVDWTALRLTVASRSDRTMGAWQDRRMQEQDALDSLGPRVRELAGAVKLTPSLSAGDLLSGDDELAGRLTEDLKAWKVAETRYHAQGGVEMSAELDLHTWLRPALVARAAPAAARGDTGELTGLVLDARDERLPLAVAPTVVDPQGHTLVALELASADTVSVEAPVLYVTDPADPAAWKRAGDNPAFGRIGDTDDGAWVLEPGSTLATDARVAPLVAAGKVVIVVAAP